MFYESFDDTIFTIAIADSEFYTTWNDYEPTSDTFLSLIRSMLPAEWQLIKQGMWHHVLPRATKAQIQPTQAWKVHCSAFLPDAEKILKICASYCFKNRIEFKAATDEYVLEFLLSKRAPFTLYGKFVTIYPPADLLRKTLTELAAELAEFKTFPDVLTDIQHKKTALFYRYGSLLPLVSIEGHLQRYITDPKGKIYSIDPQHPLQTSFKLPPWIEPPFPDEAKAHEADETDLHFDNGKEPYTIFGVISISPIIGIFTASGEVSGRTVRIKMVSENALEQVQHLKKESQVLTELASTGVVPEPIDLFFDQESCLAVVSYRYGIPLNRREFTPSAVTDIIKGIVDAVEKVHSKNIVHGDITPSNILWDSGYSKVSIIDWETAFKTGTPPTDLGTPGYRAPEGPDDMFGLGATILHLLIPINVFNETLEPNARQRFLDQAIAEGVISEKFRRLLSQCFVAEPSDRPTIKEFRQHLEAVSGPILNPARPHLSTTPENDVYALEAAVPRIVDYIRATLDFSRTDRLSPSHPFVYASNGLQLAFGSAGIAYALFQIEGKPPTRIIDWMLKHEMTPEGYAPSFWSGITGIAAVLAECGFDSEADKRMRVAFEHPLFEALTDADAFPDEPLPTALTLTHGCAGVIKSILRLYTLTNKHEWLEHAIGLAHRLIATLALNNAAADLQEQRFLDALGGPAPSMYSYLFGYPGIADALLDVFNATGGEPHFQDAASSAINRSRLAYTPIDSENYLEIPAAPKSLGFGSAGYAKVLARYAETLKPENQTQLHAEIQTILPPQFNFYQLADTAEFGISLFRGLTGIAAAMLDIAISTGDDRYYRTAVEIGKKCRLFEIQKPEGIAFPGGDGLKKITTDFASGTAGIAWLFHRISQYPEGELDPLL